MFNVSSCGLAVVDLAAPENNVGNLRCANPTINQLHLAQLQMLQDRTLSVAASHFPSLSLGNAQHLDTQSFSCGSPNPYVLQLFQRAERPMPTVTSLTLPFGVTAAELDREFRRSCAENDRSINGLEGTSLLEPIIQGSMYSAPVPKETTRVETPIKTGESSVLTPIETRKKFSKRRKLYTPEEGAIIKKHVETYGTSKWKVLGAQLQRHESSCSGRYWSKLSDSKMTSKRKKEVLEFSFDQDIAILNHVKKYGASNWMRVADLIGKNIADCIKRYWLNLAKVEDLEITDRALVPKKGKKGKSQKNVNLQKESSVMSAASKRVLPQNRLDKNSSSCNGIEQTNQENLNKRGEKRKRSESNLDEDSIIATDGIGFDLDDFLENEFDDLGLETGDDASVSSEYIEDDACKKLPGNIESLDMDKATSLEENDLDFDLQYILLEGELILKGVYF